MYGERLGEKYEFSEKDKAPCGDFYSRICYYKLYDEWDTNRVYSNPYNAYKSNAKINCYS